MASQTGGATLTKVPSALVALIEKPHCTPDGVTVTDGRPLAAMVTVPAMVGRFTRSTVIPEMSAPVTTIGVAEAGFAASFQYSG